MTDIELIPRPDNCTVDCFYGDRCSAKCSGHTMFQEDGDMRTMSDAEFVDEMRTYRLDHLPDGYPCVQTWQIDRLIEIIDRRQGWQPVDTAPYGTQVLAWIYLPINPIASGPAIAVRQYLNEDEPEDYGVYRRTIGCWWANSRFYHEGRNTGYVTHWMPLPTAPKNG